jgi:DNA-binding HxlR family transcriptional regulator
MQAIAAMMNLSIVVSVGKRNCQGNLAPGRCIEQRLPNGALLTFWFIFVMHKRNISAENHPSVAAMVEDVVGCKWSMRVLALVESGISRPGAMERAVAGLSAKVLNERLSKLTRYGVLRKTVYPEVPPRVEYALTEFGQRFSAVLAEIRRLQALLDVPEDTPR